MNKTIAKMLNAHSSITAANVLSATPPLPRVARNLRTSDGSPSGADGSAAPTKLVPAGVIIGIVRRFGFVRFSLEGHVLVEVTSCFLVLISARELRNPGSG